MHARTHAHLRTPTHAYAHARKGWTSVCTRKRDGKVLCRLAIASEYSVHTKGAGRVALDCAYDRGLQLLAITHADWAVDTPTPVCLQSNNPFLSGELPQMLGNMSALTELQLHATNRIGSMDSVEFSPSMEHLDLSSNQFTPEDAPAFVAKMPSLRHVQRNAMQCNAMQCNAV